MDSGAQDNVEALVAARTEQLRKAIANLERSHDVTLEALGEALCLKDGGTQAHSRRVTAFSICIARAMRQTPDQIRTVARGAFLHDIGNLADSNRLYTLDLLDDLVTQLHENAYPSG